MKPNIVFLDEYSLGGADLTGLHALGRYTGYSTTAPDEVADRCRDAEIVITNKVVMRRETLAALPGLRLICVAATGMNNIDLDAAAELDIAVRNAAGYSTHSVAETTLGAAIALRRHIGLLRPLCQERRLLGSPGSSSTSPNPRTSSTARSGASWGWAPSGTKWRGSPRPSAARYATPRPRAPCARSPTPPCRFAELLGWADAVSVHAPLNDHTRGLIGAARAGRDEAIGHPRERRPRRDRRRGGAGRSPRPADRSPAPRSTYSRASRWPRTTRCWASANPTGCCSRPTTHGRRAKPSTCW